MKFGGEGTKLYSTAGTSFKKLCLQNKLNLLDASVRHLGTDINYIVLKIFMITLKTRLISTLIHLLKMLNSRTVMIRKVILLTQPMKIMSAKSALFQSAEAAASGWNMFVIILIFPQSRTVLTSVFVWSSCRNLFTPHRRTLRKQDCLPHRTVRGQCAYILHESEGLRCKRKHKRHYHSKRSQL